MKKKSITGFAVVAVIIAAFLTAVIKFGPYGGKVEGLEGVEVREYQGQNLSSINDSRENSIKGPQYIDINNYQLKIFGMVRTPVSYSYDQVTNGYQHYKKTVRLNCVEGWSVDILWEGFLVRDLLKEAGPLPEAQIIIFRAYDDYTTSFLLDYVMDNDIIMAYKMNEVTIPPQRGFPFQLVAEDKWGYKWIKWITEIELSDNTTYEGFWESRGYSNTGDLDKRFLGN